IADSLSGRPARPATVAVRSQGRPVAGADVRLDRGGEFVAAGRTNEEGALDLDAGQGPAVLTVSEPSRGTLAREIGARGLGPLTFELAEAGGGVARVTDSRGGPIPCKVQFLGRDGTPNPDFGPDSGEHAVGNVYYSHDGSFRRELAPGAYDVIVS